VAELEEAAPELIERARADRQAFGEIYDLYAARVHAFCRAHSACREEAEDMTAQTFERALLAIQRYEHRGRPFSSWLLRIAGNLVVDRYRRRGGVRLTYLGTDPIPEQLHGHMEGELPARLVEQWEEAGELLAQVALLPLDQQRAITLRYWEDRSVPDVAARMGRSEGAVRQLLHRAVKSLRLSLESEALGHA
jgi:RNA polymerase sigma-70 factor (ECF subfamily)